MDISWIITSPLNLLMVLVSTVGIYLALIFYTRVAGLRSFSKMSSFDFAMTVAVGSIIATTVLSSSVSLTEGVVGLAAVYLLQFSAALLGILYLIQMGVAQLRGSSTIMSKIVDNEPLLLMRGSEIIDSNLRRAKVTHADLRAKLREANVTQLSQVKAVVMESTGDISVLHHSDAQHTLDRILLKDVQDWDST